MLHTSSNRGTPVSNDITNIVRQHYKPPSAKPYKHEVVQCRNEMSCKKDKPDDYWTTNYHRRQNNFDSGFYSTPWEPYKAIGGDLILDPFDLVASSLPGNIDRKMNPKFARRGTVYSLTERLMSASAAKKEEKDKEDTSLLSEDQIDTCPTAGFENIKKFLKESSDRMVAVRSGMSYEEHVRLAEERMREEEEGKLDTDDDMVVQSTSDSLLVPSINSPKFDTTIAEEDEDEDGDRMGTPRSILTGSSKTSASSGRRMSRSPTEKWRNLSPMAMARRMSVRTPPKKLSLGKVSSGIGTGLIRRERLCRDQLEFLTSIYSILTAIHNMKGRDLRVKVPLSKEVVEKLQKESHKESQNEGGERQSSRGTQMNWGATRRSRKMSAIDFDLGSEQQASPANSLVKHTSMSNKSRWSRKMMSTDTVDCPEDRGGPPPGFGGAVKRISVLDNVGKAFGRRRSRVASESQPTRPMLETWEDLINVQPQEYREEALPTSFGMQAGILSKFMRWYRRASVIPTHVAGQPLPAIDKDQLRHLEEVREKGLGDKDLPPLPQQPMPIPGPGGPPGSALGNQEKARKLPIWQQVAQEKSTVFQNKKSTTANSPYTLLHRIKEDSNRMKRSLQKENTAALEKLAREKVANFRLKFSALSQEECSPLYSEQLYKLQQVKENVHRSHLENFDVQPSKWYEELREKTQAQPYCDDSAICDMIIKLQTYCHMDNKTVPYAKAKLCLLTMSLPAYNICQIQTQKALKFIFEQVLLGTEAQFDEWLNHRKIPYIVQDPITEHRHSMFSPTLRPYSPSRRSPTPTGKGNNNRKRSPAASAISE